MRVPRGVTVLLLGLAVVVAAASETKAAGSSFAELLVQAKQDMETEKGAAYDKVMGRRFETKHTATVDTCVKSAGPGEPEAFRGVIVVEKDGKVSDVVLEAETEIAKCVRKALLQDTFPAPPIAPFHDLLQVSFK
jgi:hypothetical protein